MRIEDEVNVQEFRNEYHKLLMNIMFTGNWAVAGANRFLKSSTLSIEQFSILRILRAAHPEPIPLFAILKQMLDRNSNTSRLIDKLIAKGLVNRKVCPTDRRRIDITITEKGRELANEIEKVQYELIFTKMNEKDAKTLNKLLDKVRG